MRVLSLHGVQSALPGGRDRHHRELPPRCGAKVTLRRSATLKLPPSSEGKVRAVVVRSAR